LCVILHMIHPLVGNHVKKYWRWKEIHHCFHWKAEMPGGLTSQSYTFVGVSGFKTLSDSTLCKQQICGTHFPEWVSKQLAMCLWSVAGFGFHK